MTLQAPGEALLLALRKQVAGNMKPRVRRRFDDWIAREFDMLAAQLGRWVLDDSYTITRQALPDDVLFGNDWKTRETMLLPLLGNYWAMHALVRRAAAPEAAGKAIERALDAQHLAGFDRDNEHRATLLMLRGHLRRQLGEAEDASTDYRRACGVFARTHDADDPMLAECRLGWSQALGDTPEGRRLAQLAGEAYRALGPAFADELAASTPGADPRTPPARP